MKPLTAQSAVAGVDQRKSCRYQLLEQIFRGACSDPATWEVVPKEGSDELFYLRRRNTATGDTITCQGLADGSHSFTFEQGEK